MHKNTDNTYSNRLMEQSLQGGRAAGYLAASPGGALPRTKIEGVSITSDPRVGNNNNMTPRLYADSVGLKVTFLKKMEMFETLDRCCGVPISRYSVFEGVMRRRLAQNQALT